MNHAAWLLAMRTGYAQMQLDLELSQHSDSPTSSSSSASDPADQIPGTLRRFECLPTLMPRLGPFNVSYVYEINLDNEIFSVNHGAHYRLNSIPRNADIWLHAIVPSAYVDEVTVTPVLCPHNFMAWPGRPRRDPAPRPHGYTMTTSEPRISIAEGGGMFLTRVTAEILMEYRAEIMRFGGEWEASSPVFRELAHAIVSVASGQAKFCGISNPFESPRSTEHLMEVAKSVDSRLESGEDSLVEFDAMFQRCGRDAGIAPLATTYVLEGVIVSLSTTVDALAVSNVVDWGLDRGHGDFQALVMSLFEVILVEVVSPKLGPPRIMMSRTLTLSPLREQPSQSSHPLERPPLGPFESPCSRPGEDSMSHGSCADTVPGLERNYPGLAAMVNFFRSSADRAAAAARNRGILTTEMLNLVLDASDSDTCREIARASEELRDRGLGRHWLNDKTRLSAEPLIRYRPSVLGEGHSQGQEPVPERLVAFNFEQTSTGHRRAMVQSAFNPWDGDLVEWIPVIGGHRRALMLDVTVRFVDDESETEGETDRGSTRSTMGSRYEDDDDDDNADAENDAENDAGDEPHCNGLVGSVTLTMNTRHETAT